MDVRRVDVAAAELRRRRRDRRRDLRGRRDGGGDRPAARPARALRPGGGHLGDAPAHARAGAGGRGGRRRRRALRARAARRPTGTRDAVYAYDPAADEWRSVRRCRSRASTTPRSPSAGRSTSSAASTRARSCARVYVYDPAADSWSRGPRAPGSQPRLRRRRLRGEIWMIGGRRGEEILPGRLDPRTRRPANGGEGPAMPEPMELLGAAVAGDEIHAVWESTYQIYDAGTGTWRDGPALARHPPRAADVLRRRHALHGRRLHDAARATARSWSAASFPAR